MIDLSLDVLIALALRSWLFGVILGACYDLLFLLRQLLHFNSKPLIANLPRFLITFLTDFIFMVTWGIIGICLIWSSGGLFRGMVFMLMGVGFLLYRITMGRLVGKFIGILVNFLRTVFGKLLWLLLLPLKQILSALISLYHLTIGRFLGKIIREIKTAYQEKQKRKEPPCLPEGESGKEEFVYVHGNSGYRKEGRINFGNRR